MVVPVWSLKTGWNPANFVLNACFLVLVCLPYISALHISSTHVNTVFLRLPSVEILVIAR